MLVSSVGVFEILLSSLGVRSANKSEWELEVRSYF